MPAAGGSSPLFILSFRHRDELTAMAERAGWQPIAARRTENAESRFVASGAAVAVVDARGALADGREAIRALGDPAEANAAALLVLLSRNDSEALDEFLGLGATHFLVSPFSEQQFLQAVQFARRHAERVGGRRPPHGAGSPARRRSSSAPRWRVAPDSATPARSASRGPSASSLLKGARRRAALSSGSWRPARRRLSLMPLAKGKGAVSSIIFASRTESSSASPRRSSPPMPAPGNRATR